MYPGAASRIHGGSRGGVKGRQNQRTEEKKMEKSSNATQAYRRKGEPRKIESLTILFPTKIIPCNSARHDITRHGTNTVKRITRSNSPDEFESIKCKCNLELYSVSAFSTILRTQMHDTLQERHMIEFHGHISYF